MDQTQRRRYLIKYLLNEESRYKGMEIPEADGEQKAQLRALMNVRLPKAINEEFLKVQDEYLAERAKEKGVVALEDMEPVQEGIYLWQGDITRLGVDAIVNAANSGMTGCYQPNHTCIDNCIHTFAGVQLRLACADLMERQGHEEATGQAQGCLLLPGLLTAENDFKSILVISFKNIISGICIRADFIRLKPWRNSGRTGADIFISTAIWSPRSLCIMNCVS